MVNGVPSWVGTGSGAPVASRTRAVEGATSPPDDAGPPTITVPRTLHGVATALSYLAPAAATVGAERSLPGERDHPPLVAFGEDIDVPLALRNRAVEDRVSLGLPPELEYPMVAAPLAYYLGASVTVREGPPVLSAPSVGLTHRLPELPEFQRAVAGTLQRVVYLDSLVRERAHPRCSDLLETLSIDPERVRSQPAATRLARYLDCPDDRVDGERPSWPLSAYVAPEMGNVRSLPHLLADLSLVYLPDATELDGRERLQLSLDDFYRAPGGEVATVDVLRPEPRVGRLHAWLAEGTPVDAFKTTHNAYENRLRSHEREHATRRVTVVLNDRGMASERDVAAVYRNRDAPFRVTVRESLRRDELASVLATPNDVVHYIGHCDVDGLRCADGALATEELESCHTRAFLLNACGSYHQGIGLVERGAVGGAVTVSPVLDEQAATVGRTFARLLESGFSVQRAIQLARRRIMMGTDYAVVGDGTCSIVDDDPAVLRLEQWRSAFELTCELADGEPGEPRRDPIGGALGLAGASTERRLDRDTVISLLERRTLPAIYEGRFRWSDALADELRP